MFVRKPGYEFHKNKSNDDDRDQKQFFHSQKIKTKFDIGLS